MNQPETVTRLQRSILASWPRLWWLNAACALLTLVTTTIFGWALVVCFDRGRPLDPDFIWIGYARMLHGDPAIWRGLEFSIPLLLILLAHELGHYFECVRWRVDATLPYFLPSPTLFGTFGAFIRIRSAILTRSSLFDIGIAGPLAGFAVLVPFLLGGMALSPVLPAPPAGAFLFGWPLAARLAARLFHPGAPEYLILLHPMALAAWAGLLATAINLLPVGQLDGGHIVYAALGPRLHRRISTSFVGVLAVMGFWYWTWWIWAGVLFFLGRRHPLVYDREPLSPGRWISLVIVCFVFLLSFSVVPVRLG